MEQLTRLAHTIAQAYLAHAKHNPECLPDAGKVTLENLSNGLVNNAYSAAKDEGKEDIEAFAYRYLCPLINLQAKAPTITDFGLTVIKLMNKRALQKIQKNFQQTIH